MEEEQQEERGEKEKKRREKQRGGLTDYWKKTVRERERTKLLERDRKGEESWEQRERGVVEERKETEEEDRGRRVAEQREGTTKKTDPRWRWTETEERKKEDSRRLHRLCRLRCRQHRHRSRYSSSPLLPFVYTFSGFFHSLHAERESRSAAKNENNSVVTVLGTVTTLLFAGYCVANTVTSLLVGGLEHQPSPRGWAESSPQYMGRVRAIPGWMG